MLKKMLLTIVIMISGSVLKAEITGLYTYPGGNVGDVQINGDGSFDGRRLTAGSGVTITTNSTQITISASGGGGGGASVLDDLSDVTITGPSINQTLVYNGSQWVNAAQGATFSFSIASFGDSLSSTQEIGSGVWKTAGAITFSASYTNGPPTSSTITYSGWSNLVMTTPFTSKVSAQAVNYPAVSGTVVFTLNSSKSAESATQTITHTFVNRIFYGVTTVSSGYTEANVEALAGTDLQDSKSKTFSVSPGASEYILFAYPTRLGTATFTVGGFEGGFQSPVTVSVTNASGYTENYYAYRSTNLNLGSTTVVAQ